MVAVQLSVTAVVCVHYRIRQESREEEGDNSAAAGIEAILTDHFLPFVLSCLLPLFNP